MNLFSDVYYDTDYTSLYCGNSRTAFTYSYKDAGESFNTVAIKQKIDITSQKAPKSELYDLETAYGLGGYLASTQNEDFVACALEAYKNHCAEQGIVAEFIRFHPFNTFPQKFGHLLPFCTQSRETVYIPLDMPYDDIRIKSYSSNLRREIKKAPDAGCTFEEMSAKDLPVFQDLYTQTMDKNNAERFYYFGESYFQQLMTHTKSRLFGVRFKGRIINAGFILDSNPLIYYHLSANDTSLYHLHANHFFLDQVTRLYAGKRSRFFLGGGSTEEKEDPLLRFKKKFSKHRAPFYIGGLITDENAYTQLNQQWQDLHPQDTRKYFLKYRLTG